MDNRSEIAQKSGLNIHTYRLVSYGLTAAMLACAALTLVSLISRINPDWQLSYLGPLCFLVALDRLYTYRFFRNWMSLSKEWLIRHGAQAIAIIALTKTIVGLSHGWNAFLTEIPLWQQGTWTYFFDGETRFALIMAALAWFIAGNFADLLEEIGPEQIQSSRLDLERFGLEKNISARQRLISQYFSIGAFLVVLTALGRVDLRSMIDRNTYSFFVEIPPLAGGGASTLLYFMFGLALLSQTQFISLHVRWTIQDIPVNGKLAKQWFGYGLLFLALVTLFASLMPTSYAIGPLLALGHALGVALTAYLSIGQAIFLFALYLLSFVSSLMGNNDTSQQETFTPQDPPTPAPPDLVPVAGPDWWEIAKTVFFWAIFLGVLFLALRQYLRQHQDILEKLRRLPGWRFLEQTWDWLRNLLTHAKDDLESILQSGRENARRLIAHPFSLGEWINLRALNPRQRVYFYYLALIRRGGETGLPRARSQTPDEYAAALQSALPPASDDIQALTQAFIAARYSRQPVEPEQAHQVENTWERVRKILRKKRWRRLL